MGQKTLIRGPWRFGGALPGAESLPVGFLLLFVANVLWASTDVVAKLAIAELSPQSLIWGRLSFCLLAFAPVLYLNRARLPRTVRDFAPFALLGVCGLSLNFLLQYQGLKLSTASHATTLRMSEAMMIVVLSGLVLRERIARRALLGLAMGMAGIILVLDVRLRDLDLFAGGGRLGDLLILAGILVESFYTIIGKKLLKNNSPMLTTALACLAGWFLISGFCAREVINDFILDPPSLRALLACAYLGILANFVAYSLYYGVLAKRPSHSVGMSILIQPMVGIPLAAVFFNDPLTPGFVSGAVLIIAGVYFALRSGKCDKERKPA